MAVKYVTSSGIALPPVEFYEQDDEPTLDTDHKLAIWINTNDSDRVYWVFRRGASDQVKGELT